MITFAVVLWLIVGFGAASLNARDEYERPKVDTFLLVMLLWPVAIAAWVFGTLLGSTDALLARYVAWLRRFD